MKKMDIMSHNKEINHLKEGSILSKHELNLKVEVNLLKQSVYGDKRNHTSAEKHVSSLIETWYFLIF